MFGVETVCHGSGSGSGDKGSVHRVHAMQRQVAVGFNGKLLDRNYIIMLLDDETKINKIIQIILL